MATLKEIAAACETSIATVSYVLSGRGDERRISTAMQERVVRMAEELGYDLAAKARKSRRPAVAVYWPQRQLDTMLPTFITGLNAAMGMAPITADVIIQPYEPNHLSEQNGLWTPGRAGASVIVSASAEDVEALRQRRTTYPAVLVNRTVEGYPCVTIDEDEVGQLAADYAKQTLGDDVSLVLPDRWLQGVQYRSRSVQESLDRYGVVPRSVHTCGIEINDGYALGQRMLLEGKLPRGILCLYDTVAIGLAQAVKDAGLRLGQDLELVAMSMSYTNTNSHLFQNLTVIDLRQVEVSTRAINMAIELATHAGADNRHIVVHPTLIPHR